MRDRPRKSLALATSLALHLGPFAYALFSFAPDLDWEVEFELDEVQLIDPDQLLGGGEPEPPKPPEPQLPPPTPPNPTPAPGPAEEPPKPEPPKPEPEPPKDTHDLGGSKHTKADQLGPTNSNFYALLVPKKIRKLSYADTALDVMAPLPDFEFLVEGGGFDALRDFDHIVIASPEIRDPRQTFLAVDYRMSRAEVQRSIERAAASRDESIEWIEENGIIRGDPKPDDANDPDDDPRFFVLLEDNVAVYVRPEFLPHILAAEVGDADTAGNYVANLAKLKKFAAKQPTAGLQVVLKNLTRAFKRAKLPFGIPDTVELSAEASEDPEFLIRGEFPTLVDAKAFENWWKDEAYDLIPTAAKLWLGSIYEQIEVTRNGTEVQMWARFDTKQAKLVLATIADLHAKAARKTPEEMAEAERLRRENWAKRKSGKLPPSALDGSKPAGGAAAGDAAKDPPPAPPADAPNEPTEPAPKAPEKSPT
ncbi:MAG TPA: hypothetical protein VG755_31515 [Nannocystaceae bacterium]|nr:hypothetical protein [Nannocystaceae bacterium]